MVPDVRFRLPVLRKIPLPELLFAGVAASLAYVTTDFLGAYLYAGYSMRDHAVSELTAIGSPVRSRLVPLFAGHSLLALLFGVGVMRSSGRKHRLRAAGRLLVAIGVLDLLAPFVPMHSRGSEPTVRDAAHIVVTALTSISILGAVWLTSRELGRRFEEFCWMVIPAFAVPGAFAVANGSRVAANLDTPYFGLSERIAIYAYLCWMVVLAFRLRAHAQVAAPLPRTRWSPRRQAIVAPRPAGVRDTTAVT